MLKRLRALAVLTILFQLCLSSTVFGSDTDFETNAEALKPAVVMIKVNYHAQVSLPSPYMTEQNKANLKNSALSLILRGVIPPNMQAAINYAAAEVLANPLRYMSTSDKSDVVDVNFTTLGTGLIINEEGYIVTTLNMVQPNDKTLKEKVISTASDEFLTKTFKKYSGLIPGNQKADQAFRTYINEYIKVTSLTQEIFVLPGSNNQASTGMNATLFNDKQPDVNLVILKVDKANLPSIDLKTIDLKPDDQIGILTYPVTSLGPDKIEPILIKGTYSELSVLEEWNGYRLKQIVEGAPIFKSNGDILGLIELNDNADQQSTAQFSFIPAEQIIQFAQGINIPIKENKSTQLYKEAIDQYQINHYRRALKLFKQISIITPDHPYVQYYIANSESEISAGHDRSYDYLKPVAGVLIGIIVALLAWFYFIRSKKTKALIKS